MFRVSCEIGATKVSRMMIDTDARRCCVSLSPLSIPPLLGYIETDAKAILAPPPSHLLLPPPPPPEAETSPPAPANPTPPRTKSFPHTSPRPPSQKTQTDSPPQPSMSHFAYTATPSPQNLSPAPPCSPHYNHTPHDVCPLPSCPKTFGRCSGRK